MQLSRRGYRMWRGTETCDSANGVGLRQDVAAGKPGIIQVPARPRVLYLPRRNCMLTFANSYPCDYRFHVRLDCGRCAKMGAGERLENAI